MGQKGTAKKRGISQAVIARAWGVSRQMVHKWVKEGMPLCSQADAEAWRAKRLASSGKGSNAPKDLNQSRERKVNLECELLEIKIAVERADYLPAKDVEEAMLAAGALFSGGLASMVNDLPGMLAGLGELAIKDVLLAQTARLVEDFKRRLSNDIERTKRKARASKLTGSGGQGTAKPKAAQRAGVGRSQRKPAAQRKVKAV